MKLWTRLKLGHIRLRSMTLGLIIENPFVHSRRHIFSLILMKIGHIVCLDDSWDKFEIRSHRFCTCLAQMLEKPFVHIRGHISAGYS